MLTPAEKVKSAARAWTLVDDAAAGARGHGSGAGLCAARLLETTFNRDHGDNRRLGSVGAGSETAVARGLGERGAHRETTAPLWIIGLPGPGEQQKREPHSTETTVTTGNRELWEQQQGPQSETTVGRERGELGAH